MLLLLLTTFFIPSVTVRLVEYVDITAFLSTDHPKMFCFQGFEVPVEYIIVYVFALDDHFDHDICSLLGQRIGFLSIGFLRNRFPSWRGSISGYS